MKVHVVKDKDGKTIASFEGPATSGVKLEPTKEKDHKVEEIEVSENYASNLHLLYKPQKK
jgi:hypothetical protein